MLFYSIVELLSPTTDQNNTHLKQELLTGHHVKRPAVEREAFGHTGLIAPLKVTSQRGKSQRLPYHLNDAG